MFTNGSQGLWEQYAARSDGAAIRALLEFTYLAQYPIQSSQTLDEMTRALRKFHMNKDIFIKLGARTNFNFNKLHYFIHYPLLIERFGSTDNYNTEYTE